MGFPTTLSMNLVRLTCRMPKASAVLRLRQGMFVAWAILSPISKHNGWAPGPVGDMTTGARGWWVYP